MRAQGGVHRTGALVEWTGYLHVKCYLDKLACMCMYTCECVCKQTDNVVPAVVVDEVAILYRASSGHCVCVRICTIFVAPL